MGKRELVALVCLYFLCLLIDFVLWLFLAALSVGVQCVVFPDHTHLLFRQKSSTYVNLYPI